MLFSIITPSKNQGRYIKRCLDSIYGQSHCEVEHFVMDGMSEDGTAEVVARYPSLFTQQKDSGPAQAINRGFEIAKGDIVCWLNADDAFAGPEVLNRVAELFRHHPEIDVITGNGYYIDEDDRRIYPIIPDCPSHISHTWMRRSDPFLQPSTFWRRNQFRLNEKLHYTFDWQLWLEFYDAGLNICYVPEYFALYRIQSDSLTQQDRPLRRQEIYNIIAKYGDSTLQQWWCWVVWKCYVFDWRLHTTVLRKTVKLLNSLLHRSTGGSINWG